MPFKSVPTTVDFPTQEREILHWWKDSDAFNQLRRLRASSDKRFSFLDGPITANNPMGVHHAWGRTYKDLWQRYYAMQGYNERWQNGFDCQGLWIEVNVERDLGFKSKRDIEDYGIAPFVVLCKQRVLNFAAVQTEQSIRLGYWVNWDSPEQLRWLRDKLGENPNQVIEYQAPDGWLEGTVEQVVGQLGLPNVGGSYFTFSNENNYQIWRFLKTCFDRGWIYKGHDVMPWCWRCGTGISQHEIVTEGYIEKVDPGLTVRFPLAGHWGDGETRESLLVWTTTPWTLTSNVAAAVGPDLDYVKVRQTSRAGIEEYLYLSKGTLHVLRGEYEVVAELKGRDMEGWRYVGPFDDLPLNQEFGVPEAHRVILWDEVGVEEGTGMVHIAPGCGAEDFALGKQYHLPIVAPLDEDGVYLGGFGWLSGLHVNEVTDPIVEELKIKGRFYRLEKYTHRYPQCWRCQTPLVFRLVDEWFISMDGMRQLLIDVNDQIRWIPDFGQDRELDWLRNMHDWMISKKRYYGLALPIWECKACGAFEVIGSQPELKERAVEGWATFEGHTPHRPFIDAVKIKCAHCGARVERIKDVGNPWLDAGIVSMSTLGYSTDRSYWEKWFPANFITESFPGQFRNWFYALITMGAVLTEQPPTQTILGFATLLGEDGRPMHKSWGNSIEFNEAADELGADVMRWLFVRQRYDADIWFGRKPAAEVRRQFFIPLWNVYSFFTTYANLDGWTPDKKILGNGDLQALDRWIIARLHELIGEATAALDDYDAPRVARAIEPFVDDLSNWYVRRSRRRFWKSESDADKHAAYATLYEVLVTLAKLLAPMLPFLSEALYQNLVRSFEATAPESVHHCDWPAADASLIDADLLADVALARQVVTLGHATRASNNLKVRQPLAKAVVVVPDAGRARVQRMADVIADELNVKSVALAANEAELVTYRLLPDNKKLGPKFGARFPALRQALAQADANQVVTNLRAGAPTLVGSGDNSFELAPDEVLVTPQPRAGFAVASEAGVVVALDTALTPELMQEGQARDVVRRIQDLRKQADFAISDHILTTIETDGDLRLAIEQWQDYIKAETLSDEVRFGAPAAGSVTDENSLDGTRLRIGVERKG
ncbi:MAG TPA: class I tRNA ligase family protein [Anaerolineae bacterium]|nr:class I tRNA ligase family protein [Anaerolineae bacterium]